MIEFSALVGPCGNMEHFNLVKGTHPGKFGPETYTSSQSRHVFDFFIVDGILFLHFGIHNNQGK